MSRCGSTVFEGARNAGGIRRAHVRRLLPRYLWQRDQLARYGISMEQAQKVLETPSAARSRA